MNPCSVSIPNWKLTLKTRNSISDGISIVPNGEAGADVINCPDDYIIINGLRLCGYKLNDGSITSDFTMNAPVTGNAETLLKCINEELNHKNVISYRHWCWSNSHTGEE